MSDPVAFEVRDSRYHPDDLLEVRSRFKHDEDEIGYSAAFRRMADKSQMVVRPQNRSSFRSRLTHTLEVQRIALSIAQVLGNNSPPLVLNQSLVNAIALGHDLGHVPFGHAGEREFRRLFASDILKLCDLAALREKLRICYEEERVEPMFEGEEGQIPEHWLFHHALSSVRLIDRKMQDVTPETRSGILTHSWSPWKPATDVKFGKPLTYEAQAVAIADQVAGINHDTEDILTCRESGYSGSEGAEALHKQVPHFIASGGELRLAKAREIIEDWFLPPDTSASGNGWSRKTRLQRIIADVHVDRARCAGDSDAGAPNPLTCPLTIGVDLQHFLHGYERFIREEIQGKVTWFGIRDAIAESVVRTVYSFFKHYVEDESLKSQVSVELSGAQCEAIRWGREARALVKAYKRSIKDDAYDRDRYYFAVRKSANPDEAEMLCRSLQCLDYVAGMTDGYAMDVHQIALEAFA